MQHNNFYVQSYFESLFRVNCGTNFTNHTIKLHDSGVGKGVKRGLKYFNLQPTNIRKVKAKTK